MLHWADEIAEELIAKHPDLEVFTCASGISPSGVVHMGNFREVATTFFVVKALRDRGKRVRFIYSWDEYDRLRKVPVGVDESYVKYIGMPYTELPSPFTENESYASYMENRFLNKFNNLVVIKVKTKNMDRFLFVIVIGLIILEHYSCPAHLKP